MATLANLYCEVGAALHKAQLAEYNIASIYILLSRTGPITSPHELEESYWSKKTLGQLLKPLFDSGRLPEDSQLFMETFRNARNHLAHSFFVSSSEISNEEGIGSLLREVAAMHNVFNRAVNIFDRVLSDIALPLGIDNDEIKAQARMVVVGITQGDGR